MDKLCKMIDMLEDCMYSEIEKGIEKVNADEFGKVADIYKDLIYAKYHLAMMDDTKDMAE